MEDTGKAWRVPRNGYWASRRTSSRCPIVNNGHRLRVLALWPGRFTQMQVPGFPRKDFNQAPPIVNGTGYVHRELTDRCEGTVCLANCGQASEPSRVCNPIWGLAAQDPRLRELRL